jgi:hypothetical protein
MTEPEHPGPRPPIEVAVFALCTAGAFITGSFLPTRYGLIATAVGALLFIVTAFRLLHFMGDATISSRRKPPKHEEPR